MFLSSYHQPQKQGNVLANNKCGLNVHLFNAHTTTITYLSTANTVCADLIRDLKNLPLLSAFFFAN